MKIVKTDIGSFIWKTVSNEQAEMILEENIFDLYELREDDSESLVDTLESYNELPNNAVLAIEVGFVDISIKRRS